MLVKRSGFTVVAVITLALGIGANTAIFSLVNATLLRPLPVENPEEMVSLNHASEKGDREFPSFSYPGYRDLRDRCDALSGLIAYRIVAINLSHQNENQRMWGYLVSGNYFDVLGVKAARGRFFTQDDDKAPGGHPVAVITFNCWQNRFAGDPGIVDKAVQVNGQIFTILGVAPEGFSGTEIAYIPEIWFPMMMQRQIEPDSDFLERRSSENIFLQGRLKSGVSMAQAEAALKTVAAQLGREYPNEHEGKTINLSAPGLFGTFMRGTVVSFAGVLMLVVAMVLLLACTNLANLLLARATERRKEIAIRLAIGASRFRLLRQLLTESILLSMLGGGLGLLLAYWLVNAMQTFKPPMDVPISTELHLDYRVFIFAVSVSLFTGVLFGLLPALQSTSPDLVPALKDEISIGGYRKSRLRQSMVVLQITVSLVLLVCAGLVLRGLQRAQYLNPGFVPQNAIKISYDLVLQGYDEARIKSFNRQLLERVRSIAGVESAGLAGFLPLTLSMNFDSIYVEGEPEVLGSQAPTSLVGSAGPGFRQAMGIRLMEGRDFSEQDESKTRVAQVNQHFARRFWKNESAVGKRFSFAGAKGPWIEVVGVIEDGKYFSLGEDTESFVYVNLRSTEGSYLSLIARTFGDPETMINSIRREVQQLDATLPVYNVETMVEHMNLPLFPAKVAATLLGGFGLLALILAAIGLFGVMSYAVSQRTREFGIRMALGADSATILRLIISQGLTLTIIGLLIGLALAFTGTRLLSSLLYGVSATDPLTFGMIALLLGLVAFLACLIPARRAAKVDPIVALRYE
jgi:predicted permease